MSVAILPTCLGGQWPPSHAGGQASIMDDPLLCSALGVERYAGLDGWVLASSGRGFLVHRIIKIMYIELASICRAVRPAFLWSSKIWQIQGILTGKCTLKGRCLKQAGLEGVKDELDAGSLTVIIASEAIQDCSKRKSAWSFLYLAINLVCPSFSFCILGDFEKCSALYKLHVLTNQDH